MTVLMCAYTCGHDGLCTIVSMMVIMSTYTRHTYVHIRVGMITHMCAYKRGHDRAFLCIHAWE